MLFIRSLVCAALACGMAFAGGQQFSASDSVQQFVIPKTPPSTLPAPMASAIQRLSKPGALEQSARRMIAQVRIQVRKQCSIPLSGYKIPDNPKFTIRELPLPKNSPDAMPVMKAPVCPAQ